MNEKHIEIFSRIGKNLKQKRKEQGLTQEEVSKKIPKMDRSKLSDIENGKEDFVFSKLLNICDALNITLEDTLKKN
ncbi:helix-turn-helix domain-containing protein [Sphingobacterium endophyticum]|uniref:helix-turn-helix domain-containing protein n=1 Tax=Sphingobacterium endophyticum TaxID=2546448 RepID=UPI0012E2228B|nr:helix-turn-helix transcriptional regulator [Sphingobacterium endophyticum]